MAYENQCGSCANFEDFNRYSSSLKKYHCTWYGAYYYPDDTCVNSGDHYRPRSYITSMVCGRLGLDKNDEVYKTIVGFQKNVMEKDARYDKTLDQYDIVGPKISKSLETESIEVVKTIYGTFLTPVAKLIKENRCDEAIYKYTNMIEILRAHYGINKEKPKRYSAGNKMKVLAIKKNI